ncbi:hypothetical protein BDN71DRAFT_1459147 [Pleurotus eryngii]|uniref:Uncharacterized protein n=1 Tax=Pleurotus eryngii TaxID=5323 RepID=A0A9P6D0X0_PLEER|nr:hypothetical protein BDN71DRAFT_1459147 [Pleurotus eryngii]
MDLNGTMNGDILRRRTEAHLGWHPNSLNTVQARFVVSKTRHVILSRSDEAAASTIVRFAVLGVALEPIRHYLQA